MAKISRDEYRDILAGLRKIHRITRRLSRLPEERLDPDMDTALDVDYINEWLDIILCRICRQASVEAPPLSEGASPLEIYCQCMKKARRQTARLRWGLLTRKIDRGLLTKDVWNGVDSVESMLLCSAMGAVQSRRCRRCDFQTKK